MKTIFIIFCMIFSSLISFNTESRATIINVPSQHAAIQDAINASTDSDTVLVQPGTYIENINFRGKNIVLTSLFYQNNNYSFIQSTIIDGSNPVFPDSASCVIFNNHEDSSAVLQGFTLTGGTGTKWQDEHGAGLFREGGGILVQYSAPVIKFNIISGNNAVTGGVVSTGGGGIRIGDSYVRFHNNVVMNNSARYGAGIVLNYTGGEYKNNLICKNFDSRDYGAGSGIWINGSFNRSILIENNTIASNSCISSTPGVYSFGGAAGTLKNNIIWGNYGGNASQISGSVLTVRYCDVQGGWNGAGNMNVDPEFDSTNYYLKNTSPAIDKGDSSLIFNDPENSGNPGQALWPALGTVRNDMGAYGGGLSHVISNTVVSVNNFSSLSDPEGFKLYQNYPNPFNPETVISYELQASNHVKLLVYDILGNEVATLVNEKLSPGTYFVKWNASGFTSGIYYYTLKSGEKIESKKMLLIK
ncbi:MAG TPA: T9SS type A sorting domain-containing protein [Ignavibacteria bacterium]|nr:T9SS type A sorting domain-containing protein [Ignavibacteria bacterium]